MARWTVSSTDSKSAPTGCIIPDRPHRPGGRCPRFSPLINPDDQPGLEPAVERAKIQRLTGLRDSPHRKSCPRSPLFPRHGPRRGDAGHPHHAPAISPTPRCASPSPAGDNHFAHIARTRDVVLAQPVPALILAAAAAVLNINPGPVSSAPLAVPLQLTTDEVKRTPPFRPEPSPTLHIDQASGRCLIPTLPHVPPSLPRSRELPPPEINLAGNDRSRGVFRHRTRRGYRPAPHPDQTNAPGSPYAEGAAPLQNWGRCFLNNSTMSDRITARCTPERDTSHGADNKKKERCKRRYLVLRGPPEGWDSPGSLRPARWVPVLFRSLLGEKTDCLRRCLASASVLRRGSSLAALWSRSWSRCTGTSTPNADAFCHPPAPAFRVELRRRKNWSTLWRRSAHTGRLSPIWWMRRWQPGHKRDFHGTTVPRRTPSNPRARLPVRRVPAARQTSRVSRRRGAGLARWMVCLTGPRTA